MDKASGLGISIIILAIIFAINMSGADTGIFVNIPSIFLKIYIWSVFMCTTKIMHSANPMLRF